MERLVSIGIVGAVLCFVCLVGLLSALLLSFPPLVNGDNVAYMNGAYMSLGFGIVSFLGLLIYMVSLIMAPTKAK